MIEWIVQLTASVEGRLSCCRCPCQSVAESKYAWKRWIVCVVVVATAGREGRKYVDRSMSPWKSAWKPEPFISGVVRRLHASDADRSPAARRYTKCSDTLRFVGIILRIGINQSVSLIFNVA